MFSLLISLFRIVISANREKLFKESVSVIAGMLTSLSSYFPSDASSLSGATGPLVPFFDEIEETFFDFSSLFDSFSFRFHFLLTLIESTSIELSFRWVGFIRTPLTLHLPLHWLIFFLLSFCRVKNFSFGPRNHIHFIDTYDRWILREFCGSILWGWRCL